MAYASGFFQIEMGIKLKITKNGGTGPKVKVGRHECLYVYEYVNVYIYVYVMHVMHVMHVMVVMYVMYVMYVIYVMYVMYVCM